MNPLISVIVPVYNVEDYLEECINSLLRQTYQNLEIILVDDGSTDNCPAICDMYAEKDNRIRVIHKKNGGLSDARNTGLDIVRGEYIGFVDSDDWIEADMYEYLYQAIKKYDADISVCEYFECRKEKRTAKYREEARVFEQEEIMEALLYLKVGSYAVNKLYKKELWFQGIRFPQGKLYEDVRTTYKLFEKTKRIVAMPEPKYFYRRIETSITGNCSIGNKIQSVESRIERFQAVIERYPEPKAFMLKDIFRFLPDLRKSITNNSKIEFEKLKEDVKAVSSFLKLYEKELCDACDFGRLDRLSYHFMTKEKRINWIISDKIDKFTNMKKRIWKSRGLNKIRNVYRRWYESEKKRCFYKKYSKEPITESVFVESRAGEDLAGNMFEVAQELCKRGIKVYLSVKPKYVKKVEGILKTGSFNTLEIVLKWSKPYYRAFATSKYLFNDMVFEALTKRPEQIYVNAWHGTPLKTLEFDVLEQRHNFGGASREFLKCDYLAVPSHFLFEKLLTSAHVEQLFNGKALYSGYPRNSIFFNTEKRLEVRSLLGLEDKEVYVYMPTWRGNLLEHSEVKGEYSIERILDFFEENLKSNQIMYVKLHNYAVGTVNYRKYKKVHPFPSEFDAYTILNVADCLITDYSSVFFDFANTRKKIVLFTYDKTEYLQERGLYIDLEELPFPKAETYQELLKHLNINKNYDDDEFLKRYCQYDCADSCRKLLDYILQKDDNCKTESIEKDGKKNILLYDSEFERRTEDSSDIENILLNLDSTKANYYYCFPQSVLKYSPEYIKEMKNNVRLFTLYKFLHTLWTEKIFMKLMRKDYLVSQVEREYNRQIYGNVFDEIYVLGDNKKDRFARIFEIRNNLNNCKK